MKIDQHLFPTNMLDAKGKTKVLTSEAAERSTSVDPQHQITAADAKGKGLIQEGTSSGRPPRSGIVITHRRYRETWQQREDRYRRQKKIIVGRKKGADRSGIGIKITGTALSLSIVGSKTLNCPQLEIALNAMVMIGMIDLIGSIRIMISDLMGRLGAELQFMIGWGAGSVCMIDLVTMSGTFPRTKRNLRRWQMHEFPMISYSVGMLMPIEWSQGKVVAHRQGSHNFLRGVQRD